MKLLTATKHAKVVVDIPLIQNDNENVFLYSIPDELKDEVKIGSIVSIPFGRQETIGFVVDVDDVSGVEDHSFKIKPIFEVLTNKPVWDKKYLELANWISKYYLTNLGTVLSSSISSKLMDSSINEIELVNKETNDLSDLSNEQRLLIDKLLKSKNKCLSYKTLMQKSKFTKQRFYQLINQLKTREIVRSKTRLKSKRQLKPKDFTNNSFSLISKTNSQEKITLNNDQEIAYKTILESIRNYEARTFLLHGVTGSGKTEVYLKLIEDVIKNNKTVIYLVPEIYLIPQVLERLISRFNSDEIIVWHSSLSDKEQRTNWEKIQNNTVKIILGARSAVLAPIQNLGLVVIDEAHDPSFKQASPAPRYDAIKVAQKRIELESCPLILGTATPNISDYYFCQKEHSILELPNRVKNLPMPKVHLVDLAKEYPRSNKNIISNILKHHIAEALNKNEQVILLLNRRGYSSHIFCRACGYIQFCKNCAVPLVFHKDNHLSICHHCGYSVSINRVESLVCPDCKSPHFMPFGLGIQQLEEEVRNTFKNAKIIRVDSDKLRKKDEYIKIWSDFSSHKADILIGTQIVAKGLDLEDVTVVGVILADTMFNFPDYVSHERAFQLLTQVTGRAGRGNKKGNVFIQTYQADNPVFKYIEEHDYISFYNNEIKNRENFLYPPYTNLIRLIFQSQQEQECIEYANKILKELSAISHQPQAFLGPAPCFFTKLHEKYRYHILWKSNNFKIREHVINNVLQKLNKNAKVDLIVDIDSVNLL